MNTADAELLSLMHSYNGVLEAVERTDDPATLTASQRRNLHLLATEIRQWAQA